MPVSPWDPSPEELPAGVYDYDDISAGMGVGFDFPEEIQQVYVAPPIHPVAYTLGEDTTVPVGDDFDYYGEWEPCYNTGWFDFYNPGVYTIKVDFVNPTIADQIRFIYVDASPGDPRQSSRQKKATLPSATNGALIVEVPQNPDNLFIWKALNIAQGEVRAASVEDAISLLDTAFAANGPLDVVLIGHGAPSDISVGAGMEVIPGKYLKGMGPEVQAFVTALKGKVKSITLWGCHVGANLGDPPAPGHLIVALRDGLKTETQAVTVNAYDHEIAATVDSILRPREGFFSVDVHAKWISIPS